MPIDKYKLMLRAAKDVDIARRRDTVQDMAAAIGALFEKNGLVDYINECLSGELDNG